jgi:hypothetical protein
MKQQYQALGMSEAEASRAVCNIHLFSAIMSIDLTTVLVNDCTVKGLMVGRAVRWGYECAEGTIWRCRGERQEDYLGNIGVRKEDGLLHVL